jgi:hypothetical protein
MEKSQSCIKKEVKNEETDSKRKMPLLQEKSYG